MNMVTYTFDVIYMAHYFKFFGNNSITRIHYKADKQVNKTTYIMHIHTYECNKCCC